MTSGFSSNGYLQTNELCEPKSGVDEKIIRAAKKPVDIDEEQMLSGLASRIIGQDSALKDLTDATRIHLAQIKPKRPATIFMAGPTGVGKTESVNVLVDTLNELSSVQFNLIRVDCNQFMESHRVAQLLGSPPGYVGYGEPAALAPLADNPRCVVLWDEIEKAHSNVLKAIMSAMDAGKIQLPSPINGVSELDCRYSIFIFTSNLSLKGATKTIGFSSTEDSLKQIVSEEDRCKEALVKNDISPEIAGRIAWFLHYEPLTQENIAKVIRLEIEQCAISYGLLVKEISETIIKELIRSTGSKFGMRAYKQQINRKFGKTFASFKRSATMVVIVGTLDALRVIAYSK
jgi:ATP-dependent Clp protease ATP-binding subunit ClpA